MSLNLWTSAVSLNSAWGYQTVYDMSQMGHWHLANKEHGNRTPMGLQVSRLQVMLACFRWATDICCFFYHYHTNSYSQYLTTKCQPHIDWPLSAFTMNHKIKQVLRRGWWRLKAKFIWPWVSWTLLQALTRLVLSLGRLYVSHAQQSWLFL